MMTSASAVGCVDDQFVRVWSIAWGVRWGGGGDDAAAVSVPEPAGRTVNLSTAEAREEITKAELYHVIDVGEGLWCRPCQSTGCLHTLQIEQVLATAGLGTPRTGTYHELPGIARLTRYCAVGETIVECWFDNGARLRVHERRDGDVVQSVFAPADTRDPAAMTDKPDAESAPAYLVETLATYCQYRQIGDLDGLTQSYPELAHVVGEDDAATQTDGEL